MCSFLEARTYYWFVVNLVSSWTTHVIFCKAAFQLSNLQHILVHGVVPPCLRGFVLCVQRRNHGCLVALPQVLHQTSSFLLWLSRCSPQLSSLSQSPAPLPPCTKIPLSGTCNLRPVSSGTSWAMLGPPRVVAAFCRGCSPPEQVSAEDLQFTGPTSPCNLG